MNSHLENRSGSQPRLPIGINNRAFKKFFNVYLFLRQSTSGEGAEKERETQNPKQIPGSELSAQSPTQGSNSHTVRS